MERLKRKHIQLARRKRSIRKRVFGTADRPRLSVYRSNKHIYAQIVDDDKGSTICQASTRDKELRSGIDAGGNKQAAATVGKALAERATGKGVTQVAFDRNGRRYHGRIRALADAVREGGLKF